MHCFCENFGGSTMIGNAKLWKSWLIVGVLLSAVMGLQAANKRAILETTKGTIEIELFADQAPQSVKNFEDYTNEGYYDQTIFHRVIDGFVVQGGGFKTGMVQKKTKSPITNESGIKNDAYTVAMARTNDPNSATSQFFFNLRDNGFLDKSDTSDGYAVFGKVVSGMQVVDAIAKTPTTSQGFYQDVPTEDIVILRAKIVD